MLLFTLGIKSLAWRAAAPVDVRYRLEAYATLTGAQSIWLADWTTLRQLRPGG